MCLSGSGSLCLIDWWYSVVSTGSVCCWMVDCRAWEGVIRGRTEACWVRGFHWGAVAVSGSKHAAWRQPGELQHTLKKLVPETCMKNLTHVRHSFLHNDNWPANHVALWCDVLIRWRSITGWRRRPASVLLPSFMSWTRWVESRRWIRTDWTTSRGRKTTTTLTSNRRRTSWRKVFNGLRNSTSTLGLLLHYYTLLSKRVSHEFM